MCIECTQRISSLNQFSWQESYRTEIHITVKENILVTRRTYCKGFTFHKVSSPLRYMCETEQDHRSAKNLVTENFIR